MVKYTFILYEQVIFKDFTGSKVKNIKAYLSK